MNSLSNIRDEINAIDDKFCELFIKRMELSEKVAETKLSSNDEINKPMREVEIKKRMLPKVPLKYRSEYEALIDTILRTSRKFQYNYVSEHNADAFVIDAKTELSRATDVYFQGTEGSYSHEVTKALFSDCNHHNYAFFSDAFSAVKKPTDRAVIPFENSSAGIVTEVRNLLCHENLFITSVFNKNISHCLCVADTNDTIDTVRSHPQALMQCKNYIQGKGFIPITELNTAIAAKKLADGEYQNTAVICSESAANKYGLTILEKNINDISENITRFAILATELLVRDSDTHTTIVFSTTHKSGALSFVLSVFSDFGINLTALHSEPHPEVPFEYIFFAEFEGNCKNSSAHALLYQLSKELPSVKILGSYEVIQDEN